MPPMPSLTFDPPLSRAPGLIQTVRASDSAVPTGMAVWHSPVEATDGVAQILDFTIPPTHRRRGHGKRLMVAVVGQFVAYHRLREIAPRRLWLTVRQKNQVVARAFLISQGFVHVATVTELLRDEDALVYVRTFD